VGKTKFSVIGTGEWRKGKRKSPSKLVNYVREKLIFDNSGRSGKGTLSASCSRRGIKKAN